MELARALKAAAQFTADPKGLAADDPRQGILVRPHWFHPTHPVAFNNTVPLPVQTGYVTAQDGDVGVLVHLDPSEYLPAALVVDGKDTLAALKNVRRQEFRLEATAPAAAAFAVAGGSQMHVRAYSECTFPAIPPQPTAWRRVTMGAATALQRVLHAAAKDRADRPELARVHLTRHWAEASDQRRISRSHVGAVPEACLVAVDVFKHWPRAFPETGVSLGTAGEWLWVQVGEELRFAKMHPAAGYFRLDNLLPEKDHGYHADFTTQEFLDAVSRAKDTSGDGLVELAFSMGSVEVRGVTAKGVVTSSSVVRAPGSTVPLRLAFNGRFLQEAFKAFGQAVRVFWSTAQQPLRIEDAATTELVWPLVLDTEEAKHAGD